jgi:exonuclease VII large subunit
MSRYTSFQIRLEGERKILHSLCNMLDSKGAHLFSRATLKIARMEGALKNLNPKAILARGYSVSVAVATGRTVTDARTLARGSFLRTLFARGEAVSEVKDVPQN